MLLKFFPYGAAILEEILRIVLCNAIVHTYYDDWRMTVLTEL